jgi:hypothetical protein
LHRTASPRPKTSRGTGPIERLEPRAYLSAAVSFAPATGFSAGLAPIALATADFNADGHADLAVADATAEKVDVFFGIGTGAFTAGPVLSLSAPPTAIITGDFNGDGRPDIAVASAPGNTNAGTTVTVFLNIGDGSFGLGQSTTVETGVGSDEPIAIAAGDFNGDGHLDVAATDYTDGEVSVLLGTGTGTFAAPVTYDVGADPTAVAVADFNGNGHLGIAVAATLTSGTGTSSGSDTPGVLVLNGDGTGQFSAGSITVLPSTGAVMTAADLVGDGKSIDLAVGDSNSTASLLVNDGSGTFNVTAEPSTGAGSTGVAVADFNLDGIPDVVSADGGTALSSGADTVTVIPGAGAGMVAASTAETVGSLPAGVVVGDFNGDGKPDIATANEGSGTVSILLNDTVVTPLATAATLAVSSPSTPAGSPVTLTATVKSKAVSPLTGESAPTGAVNFYDGSTLIGTAELAATTAATGSTAATAAVTLTALSVGSHRLTAKYAGDAGYAAAASAAASEVITATATSGPDLVGSFVTVSLPPTVAPGEAGSVRVKVTNEGDATAVGTITNGLYLSLDTLLDSGDTAVPVKGSLARVPVRLLPGASVTLSGTFAVPTTTPLDSYVLLLDVDANGGVSESDAANDVIASPTAYTVADEFGTVGGKRGVSLSVTDESGNTGTFKLSGPGTGTVTVGDEGVDVSLAGTTAGSAASFAPVPGDSFALDDLTTGSAVGRITAPAVAVTGAVSLAAGATSVSLGDLSGVTFTAAAGVHSLSVASWTSGTLSVAGPVGTLLDLGTFGVIATVGPGASAVSLQSLVVDGSFTGSMGVTGDAGSVLIRGNLAGGTLAVGLPGTGASRLASLRVLGSDTGGTVIAGATGANGTYAEANGGQLAAVTVVGPVDATSRFLAQTDPKRAIVGGVAVDPATDPRFAV